MTCVQVRAMLSAYLDGAVTGRQMYSVAQHLENCEGCDLEFNRLQRAQGLLARVGRAKAPEDLSLKLRLAISHEAARRREPLWGNVGLRVQNGLRTFTVPATAGVVATVLIFGLLMGFITPVQANTSDVPLLIYTGPELQENGFAMTPGVINEDSLVIEAYVGADGRVQDYKILSAPDQQQDLPHPVKNMLIFTTFRPATWMGSPRPSTAILTFSRINVRG
jgi:Putative zinc-finger